VSVQLILDNLVSHARRIALQYYSELKKRNPKIKRHEKSFYMYLRDGKPESLIAMLFWLGNWWSMYDYKTSRILFDFATSLAATINEVKQ
jgi:hypothetical protein